MTTSEPVAPREEGLYLLLLKDTADAVAGTASLDEALAATVDLVAERLGFDVCSVYLTDERGDLVLAATHGLRPEAVGQVRMPQSEGLTGLVAEGEQALFTSRADEHPRFKFFPETGEERFRSFGGVPLVRRGRCVGVLTVQTVREYRFPANEVVALQTLAGQVVSLIDVKRRLAPSGPGRPATPARGLLVGLGTSPGVGLGRVAALGVDPLRAPPTPRPFAGEAEELLRFARARDAAVRELEVFAAQIEAEHGAAAAAIFRVHEELLRDPDLEARVRARVVEHAEPAEQAVYQAVEEVVAILSGAGPAKVREKADDFRDARAQLLRALGVAAGPAAPDGDGGVVLLAEVLTPAQTAHLDPARVVAIVTQHGSETSHASILARSLGIPAVVAIPDLVASVAEGERLLVDGDNGFVFQDPAPQIEAEYRRRGEAARAAARVVAAELAARAPAGPLVAGVELLANVGLPHELGAAREHGAAGIGLLRTEFFFLQQHAWPTVKEQVAFYRRALQAAPRGPVVVRLLDAGGDKTLPYAPAHDEPNPILGLRSVRFLLSQPEVARAQVEALVEAAALEQADVRVLVPLVTAGWELRAVRELLEEASAARGVPPRPLGMMVEAPSVLYQLEHLLPLADFVSLGTNDLTQYLLAVDRDNELVRQYYSPYHPAVLRALDWLRTRLATEGRRPSVCGEMAGDPLGALALLALGYRTLSVRPRAVLPTRCLVHCVDEAALPALRAEVLAAPTPADVERVLRRALRQAAPFLLEA
ncbi:MAG: phosphoenolpyruvate--protein phosphotransferase [Planctomycetes bacterium]|nr:phosphoenolpyruvate--protein phosphotransferase [Planctomycetota bacterium]